VAEGLASAGFWEQAERAARTIPGQAEQALALGPVVEGLVEEYLGNAAVMTHVSTPEQADGGEWLRTQACRLVADLLGSQYWYRAIRPLGKLSPGEVMVIAEAILAQKFWKG
jgi:hypothetical protein